MHLKLRLREAGTTNPPIVHHSRCTNICFTALRGRIAAAGLKVLDTAGALDLQNSTVVFNGTRAYQSSQQRRKHEASFGKDNPWCWGL
jgi:hypothetical protein